MEVLAGIVAGLLMGLVFLGAGIVLIAANPNFPERLARVLPRGLSPLLVVLLLVIAVPPLWGVGGAIAGLLYQAAKDSFPGVGMGSNNFIFTLIILSLAVISALVFVLIRRKLSWLPLIMTICFAVVFGWILPLLAG